MRKTWKGTKHIKKKLGVDNTRLGAPGAVRKVELPLVGWEGKKKLGVSGRNNARIEKLSLPAPPPTLCWSSGRVTESHENTEFLSWPQSDRNSLRMCGSFTCGVKNRLLKRGIEPKKHQEFSFHPPPPPPPPPPSGHLPFSSRE